MLVIHLYTFSYFQIQRTTNTYEGFFLHKFQKVGLTLVLTRKSHWLACSTSYVKIKRTPTVTATRYTGDDAGRVARR